MRRTAAMLATMILSVSLSACGGSGSSSGSSSSASAGAPFPPYDGKPATVTIWSGFTSRELGILDGILADFHKLHPSITVNSLGGINDDKIVAAIRGGAPPDLALTLQTDNMGSYCGTGAWVDLTSVIARDKVDLGVIPKAVQDYTQFQGKRCALPALADVYGLYYNKAMFAKAGITSPPKTVSELNADAEKLTVKNPDGTIKVAGFVPNMTFYENAAAHFAPQWAAQWDQNGKSSLGSDPHWAAMLRWDKKLIDFYGYNNLQRFEAGLGQEFSASNAFQAGRLAMELDGEYRTKFIAEETPGLAYGTAPAPVDPSQPNLYGGGYVTGNTLGIPKGASSQAAAWELAKYLALDNRAMTKFANGLGNVPTTTTSLKDPQLKSTPQFGVFLKIFTDPNTATNPNTAIGRANQELFQNFISKWQSGNVSDAGLQAGLNGVDQQIEAQVRNSTVGKAP